MSTAWRAMPAVPEPPPAAGDTGAPDVLLIRHAAVVHPCMARDEAPLLDAWIWIEGGRIRALGPEPCPEPLAGSAPGRTLDASRRLVIPGLVNLHHHFSQSITRAMPDGLCCHALPWLATMLPLWAAMDADLTHAAARLAAAELLLSGCTTSVDMPYLFPAGADDMIAAEVAAVRGLGLRLHLVRGNTTRLAPELDRAVGPEVAACIVETEAEALAGTLRAIRDHHDPAPGAAVRIDLGPLSATFDAPAFLEGLLRLSTEAGVGRHVHLTPRDDEVATCARLHGMRPIAFLERIGWLGARSWIAHGAQLSPEDIAVLARTGSGVAHCPHQNMRLGFPAGPVPALLRAGVRVGFGTDGSASNDSGRLLPELRAAHMIHRLAGLHEEYGPDRWLTARDMLWMAARDAAAILGRDDLGRIAPGAAADMALFDLDGLDFAGGLHDPLSTLLFAAGSARPDTVLVGGRIVVAGGRLRTGSEAGIAADANRAAAALLSRAEARFGRDWTSLAGRLAPTPTDPTPA